MGPNQQVSKETLEDIYDVETELGRGQFAVVKKCLSKENNNYVAAKFIQIKKTKASRKGLSREMIEREAGILKMIDHRKIIKLHDVFDLGTEMVLVLELLCGGELFEVLCEEDYLTETKACGYMKQVLEAMVYLHDKNIMHLDIKPENIVLKSKDSTEIKLVDFGLAQVAKPGQEIKEIMGTAEFVAPEIINYETIGFYTDMWAVGVLGFILLSGDSPFLGDDSQETFANICKADYDFEDEYWDELSDDAKQFIEKLLIVTPRKRNTAKVCMEHQWIKLMSTSSTEKDTVIQTTRLKAYVAKRRWQESKLKMKALAAFVNQPLK